MTLLTNTMICTEAKNILPLENMSYVQAKELAMIALP